MKPKQKRLEPKVLRRGKTFENKEKQEWTATGQKLAFEKTVIDLKGKKGRIDIFVPGAGTDLVSVAEIKATDWDRIPEVRIRQNALRHVRQIWRYIEAELGKEVDVSPGLIYPCEPRKRGGKGLVEELLNNRGIQCVWRKDYRRKDRG